MKDILKWSPETDPEFFERKVLAFDLDDTLTEDLNLDLETVGLLQKAQLAGLETVLVTGRPFGWADALVRLLPFSAAVAENGAIVFDKRKGINSRLDCWYWTPKGDYSRESLPQAEFEKLHSLRSEVMEAFPRLRIAADQAARLYDVAFDFAEAVEPKMSLQEAQNVADFCEERGFTAKVSNIHVNVWKGLFSKMEALQFLIEDLWSADLKKNVIYVGDSPNDAPLFSAVDMSVGVSNIQDFIEAGLEFPLPNYKTKSAFGRGAAEVIEQRLSYEQ